MQMELKIRELAHEYKQKRNQFMQVKPSTKKKIMAFEKWLCDYHLTEVDIIDSEKKFFDFCHFCGEISFFHCYDYNLSWEFGIECRCERAKNAEQQQMKTRIEAHRKRMQNPKQLTIW